MKPIERAEVLGLADYEAIRERFRTRVIAEKKLRRVHIGPSASALFENRDTVLLQIQEMLRTERITRPAAIQHEIDTYNDLLPGENELSLSLMVEIPDKTERDSFLAAARGLERHVWLVVGAQRIQARGSDRGGDAEERTTAVHYMKVPLPRPLATALRDAASSRTPALPKMELQIDHPAYSARAVIGDETLWMLREDLAS